MGHRVQSQINSALKNLSWSNQVCDTIIATTCDLANYLINQVCDQGFFQGPGTGPPDTAHLLPPPPPEVLAPSTQKKQICHADRKVCHLRCIILSSHQSCNFLCWNDVYFDRKMWRFISHNISVVTVSKFYDSCLWIICFPLTQWLSLSIHT